MEKDVKLKLLGNIESGLFIAAIVVILAATAFVLFSEPIICVTGRSMNPTYYEGDYLTGRKYSSLNDVEYGDVVVLKDPESMIKLIKRVIALPGDSIMIKESGVYVNGEKLERDFPMTVSKDTVFETITLKDNEIFVMGDNRDNSRDSRSFGPVKYENIKYKVTGNSKVADSWWFSVINQLVVVGAKEGN